MPTIGWSSISSFYDLFLLFFNDNYNDNDDHDHIIIFIIIINNNIKRIFEFIFMCPSQFEENFKNIKMNYISNTTLFYT